MYQTYIWSPKQRSLKDAEGKFRAIVDHHASLYLAAWGIEPNTTFGFIGELLIAQVSYPDRIRGWTTWSLDRHSGVVWNGVCETFLDHQQDPNWIDRINNTIKHKPKDIMNWVGRFFLVSKGQNSDTVYLTTAATEAPTLWCTSGKNGWAAGTRALPLLEMVGAEKAIDESAMNLFLGLGFVPSGQSLLRNVQRVGARTQIEITPGAVPQVTQYCSLIDYFEGHDQSESMSSLVERASAKLVERIGRQIQCSENPVVLLTGGRDSRCIAAVAKKVGYINHLSTGGGAHSIDYKIASDVAASLQLPHHSSGESASFELLTGAQKRLLLWSQLSEGIETIRHARSYPDYFSESLPVSEHGLQYFHGLGGEVLRGFYYSQPEDYLRIYKNGYDFSAARKNIMRHWLKDVKLSDESKNQLDLVFNELDEDINALNGNGFHWLDCFYWQNRVMHWGEDLVSTKNPIFWVWTPLLDRELINLIFKLSTDTKRKSEFIEHLTNRLAPSLSAIRYDSPINVAANHSSQLSAYRKLKGNVKQLVQPMRDRLMYLTQSNKTPEVIFWESILLRDELLTDNVVPKKTLRLLSKNNPNSDVLWNVATIELFNRALIQ